MKHLFLTGATGYLGSYAATRLIATTDVTLHLLVRAPDRAAAIEKLWRGWQLHLDADAFAAALERVRFVHGDLHADGLGLDDATLADLTEHVDGLLHIAASLNRKSEKACLNTNLRGGLATIQVARHLVDHGRLTRFGFVSTVAIAGHRDSEDVGEDDALDWSRSDYDPYARTKKFGEHMVRTLLPDIETVVFRPAIVMGDPRFPQTTQFDMLFATKMLADLPILPLDPEGRVDIVDAEWCGHGLADLFVKPDLAHDTYHLSAGRSSPTVREITEAIHRHVGRRTVFAPQLEDGWKILYRLADRAPRKTKVRGLGALWKVFWPYVTYDTVFLNERAVAELGRPPASFPTYFPAVYDWLDETTFRYPYAPLPEGIA